MCLIVQPSQAGAERYTTSASSSRLSAKPSGSLARIASVLGAIERRRQFCPLAFSAIRAYIAPPMARPKPVTFDKLKIVAENRRARFDYSIEDTFEAGLALQGTEVKALRRARRALRKAMPR
jgi:hypothetical protein